MKKIGISIYGMNEGSGTDENPLVEYDSAEDVECRLRKSDKIVKSGNGREGGSRKDESTRGEYEDAGV